jgi:UPF0176 protein
MKNRGFREVYQIEGGIVRYGEKYRNRGLWEGSLYVFDGRLVTDFGEGAEVLGSCDYCGEPTNSFHNCEVSTCRRRVLVCDHCEAAVSPARCTACR